MEDFFTNYFAILFFPLVFLLGIIIYRGKDSIWKENLSEISVEEFNESLGNRKYYRVLDSNGEAVEGGYCGWSNLRESAIFDAKQRGLTEDNIHEYNLSAKEAEEKGVPEIFINFPSDFEEIDKNKKYLSGSPMDIGYGSGIYTGPRGGRYRINSKGRKSYDVR